MKESISYLLWNTADLCFLILYMNRIYVKKNGSRKLFYLLSVLLLLFTTLSMQPKQNYYNPTAITVMSFPLLFFYLSRVRSKILFSLLALITANLWGTALYLFLHLLHLSAPLVNLLVPLAGHLGFGILLLTAAGMIRKQPDTLPFGLWAALFGIPVISTVIFACIFSLCMKLPADRTPALLLYTCILLSVLVINFVVFYLLRRYSDFSRLALEGELLVQQASMQEAYYRRIEQEQEEVRAIRHDMRNTFDTLLLLAESGQYEDAAELLSSSAQRLARTKLSVATGNPAIDSVLNIKREEALRNGISFDPACTVPPDLALSFEQAIALFGNLCDNAIEACLPLPADERVIRLKISYVSGLLYINMENSCSFAPSCSGGELTTRKPDKRRHGIGLKNVRKTVEEFHGTMEFTSEDRLFTVRIVLFLP